LEAETVEKFKQFFGNLEDFKEIKDNTEVGVEFDEEPTEED